MAETKDTVRDPVRQFNVFTENRVGRLSELVRVFNSHDVHVVAVTVLDTTDSAIIRLVVDDPEQARELLSEQGFHFYENIVLAVEIGGEADLKPMLQALLEAEVNVHYMYPFLFRPREASALALSVDDIEISQHILSLRGFRVLGQGDIAR
jgi:hypothetical protein